MDKARQYDTIQLQDKTNTFFLHFQSCISGGDVSRGHIASAGGSIDHERQRDWRQKKETRDKD